MMRRENGQALLLVLIILAIGTLMIVPALRLTQTSLQSIQIITRQSEGLYVVGAAQEKIMWMLYYGTLTDNMTQDGDKVSFTVDVCDAVVSATVTMRAVEAPGGVCLTGDDVIRPTKTVDPSDNIIPDTLRTYTYTINLEQISDNTSQGLDAIYDILPSGFGSKISAYVTDSSYLSVDGGPWEWVPDPEVVYDEGHLRLKWPAEYVLDTETGTFSSNLDFLGIQDFTPGQVKKLRFKVAGTLKKEEVYRNWVVLKPWNTLSGATAPITVGSPIDDTSKLGMLELDKVADPELILPGVETPIEYTISITNKDGSTRQIEEIVDYLPPEFFYADNSTSGNITTLAPQFSTDNVCDAERQVLRWTITEFTDNTTVSIKSGETLTLTFGALATKEVSGTYYNEVFVFTDSDADLRKVFENIGVSAEEFGSTYSWNAGTVIVPAYDSETSADGENVMANFGLDPDGVIINSWVIK